MAAAIIVGVDADTGLEYMVTMTAANEMEADQVPDLLHGREKQV